MALRRLARANPLRSPRGPPGAAGSQDEAYMKPGMVQLRMRFTLGSSLWHTPRVAVDDALAGPLVRHHAHEDRELALRWI
jgi:hypothetical protein